RPKGLEFEPGVRERIAKRNHPELVRKQGRVAVVRLVARNRRAYVGREKGGVEATDGRYSTLAAEQRGAESITPNAERARDAPSSDVR
ncbi:MAG: hypothetical protein JRG70_13600, partial [Deltaproteobacteria bacterium]|nr:hypothetical protein [Deltaproteobacteria bacterium]